MKPFALALITFWQQAATRPTDLPGVFRDLYRSFLETLPGILTGILVFAVFFLVASIGKRVIAKLAPRVNADTGVVLLLSRVFYYGVLIFGVLTALPATGLNVSALVAGIGLTGFAIGFALKDVLSNLLSGIMLLVYRPFQIGDQIKMGEFEGVITTIRMRDTVLHAPDGRSIIIPNTKLITEVVVNSATAQLRRDTLAVELKDERQIAQTRKLILDVMRRETAHIKRVEPQVTITHGADNSGEDGAVMLEGCYWFDPRRTTQAQARERLAAAIERTLTQSGIAATLRRDVAPANAPAATPPADEEEPSANDGNMLL